MGSSESTSFTRFQPKGYVTPEKTKIHAEVLSNRIRARFRHLSRKFKKENIDCFRLYDWDIKDIRAVVDWYAGHVVVAEYVREQTGPEWLPQMADAIAKALNVPAERMYVKHRKAGKARDASYSKIGSSAGGHRFEVRERNLKFWVNLEDFLDTGLFSDHRNTRQIIGSLAKGKDFLNLYAYTGAFTCAAAMGGARSTTTVDRSDTYLKWAKDNMDLNNIQGPRHILIQSDVEKFLVKCQSEGQKFMLAFVDPPSFFKDQYKGVHFDVNEDHPELLQKVLKVMLPGSLVFFSTNHQGFEPRLQGLPVRDLVELTPKTIPEDYRNRFVHRCWKMTTV